MGSIACQIAVASLLAACLSAENHIAWGPLSLSQNNALQNMEDVHKFIQGIYYSKAPQGTFREIWGEVTEGLAFLEGLALGSTPALCFAIGMELYHWFYFRWRDGEVPLAEVDDSAQRHAVALLWCGLENAGCLKDAAQTEESIRGFMEMGCHIFWQQMVMIEAEIGLELSRRGNVRLSARVLRNASEHFSQMMRHPYFSRFPWQHPHDMNFNHEMFPSPGPVWPSKMLPIESWLEEHFAIFREELDALLQHAGLFDALHEAERNAEGQDHARDTDWTVLELADTREEEPWKLAACSQVPRTCRLLQSRPEFQCDHAAAYINRMRPGAWIKPHMGGPPRLVAHLGLDVPDAPIELYVGTAKLNWETGRAHVIDDTYPHSARYLGEHDEGEERYILHLLMCHPCEEQQRAAYKGQEQVCDPGAHGAG